MSFKTHFNAPAFVSHCDAKTIEMWVALSVSERMWVCSLNRGARSSLSTCASGHESEGALTLTTSVNECAESLSKRERKGKTRVLSGSKMEGVCYDSCLQNVLLS